MQRIIEILVGIPSLIIVILFLMAFPATFIGLVAAMRPALSKSGPMTASALVAAGSSLFVPLHWSILLGTITGLVLAAVSE